MARGSYVPRPFDRHEFEMTQEFHVAYAGRAPVERHRSCLKLQERQIIHYHRGRITILDREDWKSSPAVLYGGQTKVDDFLQQDWSCLGRLRYRGPRRLV